MYNLENSFIDWRGAIGNFSCFADELVISTLPKDFEILRDYIQNFLIERHKVKIMVCKDISLEDPLFDGKLKNAALKCCKEPFCILLDADERIGIADKPKWIEYANLLSKLDYDAFLLPVVDLFNSYKEYKSIGLKWYLSKNLPNLNRGVVNFAINGDKIDINKSDTTELIYDDGSLVRSTPIVTNPMTLEAIKKLGVKVWHLGWLDKENRLKSNEFWQPVWNARAGKEVNNIIHSKEKLDIIEYWPHGLRLWHE